MCIRSKPRQPRRSGRKLNRRNGGPKLSPGVGDELRRRGFLLWSRYQAYEGHNSQQADDDADGYDYFFPPLPIEHELLELFCVISGEILVRKKSLNLRA